MVSKSYLPLAEWFATLPTAFTSACLLLTDPEDRVLLVKPNYRDHWQIPGGIVENHELPHIGAAREIHEELGLVVEAGDLLVVDWSPPLGERPRPMINFLFDGGVVEDPGAIRLQEEELDESAFLPWDQAIDLLPSFASRRLAAGRQARKNRCPIYLPAALPGGPT